MFNKTALTALGLAIVAGSLAAVTQPAEAYWNKHFSRAHNLCINDGGTWRHGDCFFRSHVSRTTYRTYYNSYPSTYYSYPTTTTTRYHTYTYPSYSSYYYSYPTYRGSNGYWYNGVWYPM